MPDDSEILQPAPQGDKRQPRSDAERTLRRIMDPGRRPLQRRAVAVGHPAPTLRESQRELDPAGWDALVERVFGLRSPCEAAQFEADLTATALGEEFARSPVCKVVLEARFPAMTDRFGVEPVRVPVVGDDVLYVSYGTPGGEYRPAVRSARVTEVGAWVTAESDEPAPVLSSAPSEELVAGAPRRLLQVWDPYAVALFVMNPQGTFHNAGVRYHQAVGMAVGGTWHWPARREPEVVQVVKKRLPATGAPCEDGHSGCWVRPVPGLAGEQVLVHSNPNGA